MRDAISGTQCKLDAIRDGLILLEPPLQLRMRSNQWHSVAIRRNQTQSDGPEDAEPTSNQWQSDAIRRNQTQSDAIRRT